MDGLELIFVELALVVLLAVLSMSEAALHAIRRPQVVEELVQRGRRGQRAGRMGERRVRYLAAIQVLHATRSRSSSSWCSRSSSSRG